MSVYGDYYYVWTQCVHVHGANVSESECAHNLINIQSLNLVGQG